MPQIAGLKDATGDPSRVARLRMLVGRTPGFFRGMTPPPWPIKLRQRGNLCVLFDDCDSALPEDKQSMRF